MLRYLHWLAGIMHGDLGHSLANGRAISDELLPRLANTLFLAGYAAVIAIPLAVGLGIASAIWRGSVFDRLANTLTLISISVPEFFVGYILVIAFAIRLTWFPSLAMVDSSSSFIDRLYVCTLPMLTLDAGGTGAHAAHDACLGDGSHVQPVYRKRRAKGHSPLAHCGFSRPANALAPIINVVAFNLAYLWSV